MDIVQYYREAGAGEPLLLLHGNGESSEYFTPQIEAFQNRFHVYAPDTRGHGKTPRGSAPFTIRQFADDLLEFMEIHKIAHAHLLGFSDGGNIAMIFAIRHPERVDRLILNGANLVPFGVKFRAQLPVEMEYRLCALFAKKSAAARKKRELLGLMVKDPDIREEELERIQAKTLVIAGTHDVIRREHTCRIAAHIRGAQLTFIEGGHFVSAENPEAFNRAVTEFLA